MGWELLNDLTCELKALGKDELDGANKVTGSCEADEAEGKECGEKGLRAATREQSKLVGLRALGWARSRSGLTLERIAVTSARPRARPAGRRSVVGEANDRPTGAGDEEKARPESSNGIEKYARAMKKSEMY
uniref:DUF834 domain-containing protein n=1 Tax=Oryza punctata TaxID=4537 RepID=A0A0E0KHW5_ORYPU